jgi:hypothetical protein
VSDLPVLHRGVSKGRCRSCKKEVVFAETSSAKLAPFELDPAGIWTIENGAAKHLGPPEPKQPQLGLQLEAKSATEEPAPIRYTSHFSACPNARQWRK